MISQKDLVRLANKWEINWKQEYRLPSCADCGKKGYKFWHCWLKDGGYFKELHLCRRCYRTYE